MRQDAYALKLSELGDLMRSINVDVRLSGRPLWALGSRCRADSWVSGMEKLFEAE